LRDAIASTNLQTVVGPVKWGGAGPMRNVSKTPLVLGQWVKGSGKNRYDLVIVNNEAFRQIPLGGQLKPL
jgi:branched-chain amino acid transport system substrate-binding protein